MKKIITAILTVILTLTTMTCCFAEVGSQTFDIEHDTMQVWIDDEFYAFELVDITVTEDDVIYATFVEETGEYALILGMDSWLDVGNYYAEDQRTDVVAMGLIDTDGNTHYSSCYSGSVKDGDYCDVALTVTDEYGWYQGGLIGYTSCETSYETHSVVVIFDFEL